MAQMIPQVLIVEDDDEYLDVIISIFDEIGVDCHITIAQSRDDAKAKLESQFFDLAILDLKIPTADGLLDLDPEHGRYVFHLARKIAPGTKLLVLTGSPSEDFISDLLQQKHDADIWGEGSKVDTVEFLRKIEIDEAPKSIGKALHAINALDDIELDVRSLNLDAAEDRLIRIFAKRFGANRCVVSRIGAGRSGARTLRLQLFDDGGAPVQEVVAKLNTLAKIQDEEARYENGANLLDRAATPRKMAMLEFGAGPTAGLFYQLATGHDHSMYAAIAADDLAAAEAVEATAAALAGWSKGKRETPSTVADVRREWVDDELAKALHETYSLDWATAFEQRSLQVRSCTVHGDLHGDNVLVAIGQSVAIIDFGEVGRSVASYDPVSLELSVLLQENPTIAAWPTADECRTWHDLDRYLASCPMPKFVQACRDWAGSVAAGKREVAASAYTYLLRQLKYDDTDNVRILALLDSVRQLMAST